MVQPVVGVVPLGKQQCPGIHPVDPAVQQVWFTGQMTGVPAQLPLVQTSPVVQALPSLQVVPLSFCGLEQRPVPVLQVPATWHWSSAVQTTGLPPTHDPF